MTATTDAVKGKLVAKKEGATPGKTVYDLLEHQKSQIARALPAAMSADRFARIIATECRRTPKLMACTPVSLLGAVMVCAQIGLEPGPLGHAYLVPFRNKGTYEVQLIIGYRGYVELARRSGQIESIAAREVCANDDEFSFEYGLNENIVHRPALTDRGDEIAYYAVARFKGGGHTFVVLSKEQVDARRGRSKATSSGPWVTDYTAMARKTALRALVPFLPLTIEAEHAIAVDEAVPTTFGAGMVEDLALEQSVDPDPVDGAGEDVDPAGEVPPAVVDESTGGASPEVVGASGAPVDKAGAK